MKTPPLEPPFTFDEFHIIQLIKLLRDWGVFCDADTQKTSGSVKPQSSGPSSPQKPHTMWKGKETTSNYAEGDQRVFCCLAPLQVDTGRTFLKACNGMSDDFPFVGPKPSPCRQPPLPFYRWDKKVRADEEYCLCSQNSTGSAFSLKTYLSFYHCSFPPTHPDTAMAIKSHKTTMWHSQNKISETGQEWSTSQSKPHRLFPLPLYSAQCHFRKGKGWVVQN